MKKCIHAKKPIIAVTYCDFNRPGYKDVIAKHVKRPSLYERFKSIAKTYHGMHHWRVWSISTKTGEILYDTARRDHSREAIKVRMAPLDDLPLMMGRLKTEEGREELRIRLREGK